MIQEHLKFYKQYYGPIPKESNGRPYEIHHIDGNHFNNDPKNLKAVTIQEHYDIHYKQGDYGACLLIANRMSISPKEKSRLSSLANLKLVKENKHHFIGGAIQKKLVAEGKHIFLGPKMNRYLVESGKHPFLNRKWASERSIKENKKRVENGTHNFLHPKSYTCPHCGKIGKTGVMFRYHFDNCKGNK